MNDNEKSNKKTYKADVYVLALLKTKDPSKLNLLDMKQWIFYLLSRKKLSSITNNGNSISLSKLEKEGIRPVMFSEIKKTIRKLI